MNIQNIFRKPFTRQSLNIYATAVLAVVPLLPLLVVLQVNQQIQNPGLFFGGLALYAVIFVTLGWKFELWRMRRSLSSAAKQQKVRTAGAVEYACLAIITNLLPALLTLVWLITLVRNILIYPVAEWGHAYPDPAWGGPTWQGAIALHTGSAIVSIFVMPWLLQWFVSVQAKMVKKFLA